MTELRKVRIGDDYWHVVDDDPDNSQIIGSLLMTKTLALPWRAEYAPMWGAPEDFAVSYHANEQEALDWLEDKVKGN